MAAPESGPCPIDAQQQLRNLRDFLRGDITSEGAAEKANTAIWLSYEGVNVGRLIEVGVRNLLPVIEDVPEYQPLAEELQFLVPLQHHLPGNSSRTRMVSETKRRLRHLDKIPQEQRLTGVDTLTLISKAAHSLVDDLHEAGKKRAAGRWQRRFARRFL